VAERTNDYSSEAPPQRYEIVQANERVPHWFRCLVVVDEIKPWGVQGYTTIPRHDGPGDAFIRLTWDEICLTGGFNRFIVKEVDDNEKPES
jgi:hypothetical protein